MEEANSRRQRGGRPAYSCRDEQGALTGTARRRCSPVGLRGIVTVQISPEKIGEAYRPKARTCAHSGTENRFFPKSPSKTRALFPIAAVGASRWDRSPRGQDGLWPSTGGGGGWRRTYEGRGKHHGIGQRSSRFCGTEGLVAHSELKVGRTEKTEDGGQERATAWKVKAHLRRMRRAASGLLS